MNHRAFLAVAALVIAMSGCASPTPPVAAEPTPPGVPATHEASADAALSEPATQPIAPTPDGGTTLYRLDDDEPARCPLAIAGVRISADEAPNGIALTFRTDGNENAIERVRTVARRWYDDLEKMRREADVLPRARARVEYSDAPGGAVVMFVPENLEELETVRSEVEHHEQQMERVRACPLLQSVRNYSTSP